MPGGVVALIFAVRGRGGWAAAGIGAAYGVTYFGVVLFWLWSSIGVGAWVALTLVQACWFAGLGTLVARVQRMRFWPALVPVLWGAVEVARSSWPLGGLPWGRLGFALVDTPWRSLLPLVGVLGATLVMLGFASALSLAVVSAVRPSASERRTRRRMVLVPVALALGPVLLPTVTPAAAGAVTVGVVQGGVPGDGTDVIEHHRQVTRDHVTETGRLAAGWGDRPPAFVVWPESSTGVDPTRDATAGAAIARTVDVAGVPLLAGSVMRGTDGRPRNQGTVWTGDGPGDAYTKQHLVPFGEWVPFRPLASRLSARVAALGPDMVPGSAGQSLTVAGTQVAAAICFDVAYDDVLMPQVVAGADLITVQTSNAMFARTAQPEQQWAVTRARALEAGRSVVVSSINGVSGVIGPDGAELVRLPPLDTASAAVTVPLVDGRTPASWVAPWLGDVIAVGGFLVALIAVAGGARPHLSTIKVRNRARLRHREW